MMRYLASVASVILLLIAWPSSAAAGVFEPGAYCLNLWPGDRDAYSLCQNLQNRNAREFLDFLQAHALTPDNLSARAARNDPAAGIAETCLHRGAPDFQTIWQCTRRAAKAAGMAPERAE